MKVSSQPVVIFLLMLSLSYSRCSATPAANTSPITPKQLELGVTLLQRNISANNLALSPYSIHAGLTLARVGAVGTTGVELDRVLFPSPYSTETLAQYATLNATVSSSSDTSTVTLANSIWITDRGSFTAKFLRDTSSGFQAEPRTIDFQRSEQARKTINEWVSRQTKSLIPNLLPPGIPRPQTTSTLVNALYFKGSWDTPFQKGSTKDGDFFVSRGSTVKVPMMHQTGSVPYLENGKWQVAQLSYARGAYSYLVLLPRERRNSEDVARELSPALIRTALDSSTRSRVKLTMPRHKIRQRHELAETMRSLGVVIPFSDRADFSEMTALPVTIQAIIHEAVVQVDEVGTEAAAATAVIMAKTAFLLEDAPKEMKVDRPFAFAIVHTASQAPLFLGVVGDPRG
jgi:serpin B